MWKIKALRYFPFWHGSFAEGWPKTPIDFHPDGQDLSTRRIRWARMS